MKAEKKQFGKYDGGIFKDPSFVTTCTEQELYLYIDALELSIELLNHAMADGTVERFDPAPYQYALEYCIMHTTRFGVKIDEPKEGEHVKVSDTYLAWFRWWNEYFHSPLTMKALVEYYLPKLNISEDISLFRPTGDWR